MTHIRKIFEILDHLPTTRIRVLITIGLITATGTTYLMHACDARLTDTLACAGGWEPSLNWLIFLSALAGVDVTQYFAKSYTAVKQAEVDANVAAATAHTTSYKTINSNTSELSDQDKG
jgi:hypothetical protein